LDVEEEESENAKIDRQANNETQMNRNEKKNK
jgi:hypothetical protein